jgi:DNA-binding response OmpR family regulator
MMLPVDSSDSSENASRKAVLLLADGNANTRKSLSEHLSSDYEVMSVSDGIQALELVKRVNPDIIISAVLLPKLRGDVMCRTLKSSIETSHIPLILLSALTDKESIIMGLEAGAIDYITKPFDLNILKARIRNILKDREQMRRIILSEKAATELGKNDYVNLIDKKFLDRALRIVEEHIDNSEFSINEFCGELAMSRTAVYNKLKALANQAPNNFICIIRLNKAKELLATKNYTIAETAYLVGFSDPKYFSIKFKKQFGVSPKEIKR